VTSKVTLEGSIYLIEKERGSEGRNLDVDDDASKFRISSADICSTVPNTNDIGVAVMI
jgi:hypothetical protein